jgi:DNA helicase HerA-like ATPase
MRLNSLHRLRLFSDVPTTLADLLRPGRVRLLLLGQLSPALRSVVAGLLLRQLFQVRARAAEASKTLRLRSNLDDEKKRLAEEVVRSSPPKTLVCIDEAQGYAPPTKANPCTPVLIQFVKEGRNHGLSLCFTSQQPSAIHAEVLSQIDSVIAHRLAVPSDIEAVLKNAKGRSPQKIVSGQYDLQEADLLRELAEGQAWVSHPNAPRSLVVEVRPRITAHGGIEG